MWLIRPSAPRGATKCRERSEEHTSELQSRLQLVCRLLPEKKQPLQALPFLRVVEPAGWVSHALSTHTVPTRITSCFIAVPSSRNCCSFAVASRQCLSKDWS